MVWVWGGNAIQIDTPDYLAGPVPTPIVVALKSSGEAVFLQYPLGRLVIFAAAALIGIAMWLALHRTRIGVMIRAGVDDRDMLSVLGYRVQLLFVAVFAFGAGLAGMAGIVGGTFQSISLGEDSHFLLASLVVVIVGGMGSIPGAALGALIIGLSEQFGPVYFQNYATVLSFLIMVIVLACARRASGETLDGAGADQRIGSDSVPARNRAAHCRAGWRATRRSCCLAS